MRSSSVTLNVARPPSSASERDEVSRVGRSKALLARRSRRSQPFATAGARARRVEEIAGAARRVRPDESRAASVVERAPGLVLEEGRGSRPSWQAPLLQAEHEDDLEATGTGSHEIEHGDPPRLARGCESDLRPLEHRDERVRVERAAE